MSALTWTPQSSPGAVAGAVYGIAASTVGTICQAFNYLGNINIYRSTNGGVSWALVESYPGLTNSGATMACDGSVFLVSEFTTNVILRSTDDGLTWNAVPSGITTNVPSFAFTGTGTWLGFSTGGAAIKSVDGGASWSPVTIPPTGVASGFWDGSQFVMSAGTAHLYTSPDGVTWTDTSGFSNNFGGNAPNVFAKQGSRYVAGLSLGGYLTYTTPPPSGWPPGTPTAILSLDATTRTFMMGGASVFTAADKNTGTPQFASSSDGVTWALDTIVPNGAFAVGTWVPTKNLFIFASDNGHIFTSNVLGLPAPDVTNLTLADATTAIIAATFIVGTVTYGPSGIVPAGSVISQNPTGGTITPSGSPIDLLVSTGIATVVVPNVVGLTQADATTALTGAGLIVGTVTVGASFQPLGRVTAELPVAGTVVALGSAVNLVESDGLIPVPNVVGEQLIVAENTIMAAGLTVGPITAVQLSGVAPGTVNGQSPAPGTGVLPGTPVTLTSVSAITNAFDVRQTVISQYANSPTLLRLLDNMAEYIDPSANFLNFFSFVWNVNTAVGFGLDIWGRIVGVSRVLPISGVLDNFGFHNSDVPPDWQPFNQAPFFTGNANTGAYTLPDDAYRTLILTKALANITATNAQALNQLVRNLFPGRGKCYVQDLGHMAMSYVFEFPLSSVEYAILTQSGVLPHPAGVLVSVFVIPSISFVGFIEAGAGFYQPFNYGQFYIPGE